MKPHAEYAIQFPDVLAALRTWTDKRWPWIAAVVALLGFFLQIKLNYPGVYLVDSQDQLDQAISGNFNDWHPPAMAYFWRLLISLTGTPATMYLFQLACYWLGIGLVGEGLIRSGHGRSGAVALLIGFCPVFLYVNSLIAKDTQMTAALLLSFALVFRFRILGRRVPLAVRALAAALLVYAILVRINAAFAMGPLALYFMWPTQGLAWSRAVPAGLLATLAALGLTSAVNGHVLPAHPTEPIRSLELFDIVGVAKFSGDLSRLTVLVPIDSKQLDACYTPYWWDSISPWGNCPQVAGTVMNKEFKKITSDRDVYPASARLRRLWLGSIVHHPLAYMEHRIKHFNGEVNFFVPALQRRLGLLWYVARLNAQDIRQDYVKKSFITWPVLWLALTVCTLLGLRGAPAGHAVSAARMLAWSGLTYGMAYLFIGVASESRYMYWTMLSSGLAAIIGAATIAARLRARDTATLCGAATLPLVVVAGMTSRLMDLQFMLH